VSIIRTLLDSLQAVSQGATFRQIPGKRLLTMMRVMRVIRERAN